MSFAHWLVILSAVISLTGAVFYVRDTLAGKTKPNRVSWGMWAFAAFVGVGAALSAGADPWALSRIFLAGFTPVMVLVASFLAKNGYWKLTKFDFGCGVLSAVALFAWLAVGAASYAIFLAAAADLVAALPTIVKAWKYPETESPLIFGTSLLSVLLVLPSIPVWNVANSAFPVYLILINIALLVAANRRRLGFNQ